jgi:hypothetical protein
LGATAVFGPPASWGSANTGVSRLAPHCRAALGLLAAPLETDVAVGLLDQVVAEQWDAPGQPWDASFGGTPTGPVAWIDGWDPNLRSLVGLMLAVGSETLGGRPAWTAALVRAVEAEEAIGRLTPSYGNIAAAHAACALAGANLTGSPSLLGIGSRWLGAIEEDLARRGGWCEHASPTYAGVCAAALAGAARWAPAGIERQRAERLARRAGAEIAAAWDPAVGELIGPFGRAYHLRGADHVAVTGLALAGAGVDAAEPAPGARHPEDWGWAAVLAHLDTARYIPDPPTGSRAAARTIEGFGEVTWASSPDGATAWGAVAGRPEDWHHQTVTASIHGGGGAAWLWHPAVAVRADGGGLAVEVHPAGDGNPTWLWGRLQRPGTVLMRPPEHLALRLSCQPETVGRRVAVPGAFRLELEQPPEVVWLVTSRDGPPGYELRLTLTPQRIAVLPLN